MKVALVNHSSSTLEVPEHNITLRRKSKPLDPRLDNSVPADIEEHTSPLELTRLPRQNIGWDTLEMFPYWIPDEDYEEDPANIIPLACMNLAFIANGGLEIGNALEEGAATKDRVLIIGAFAVAVWQVGYFSQQVAPQLKALRDSHPEWLVQGADRQDDQVDWMPDAGTSFATLCSQLMDGAKEAYAAYKSKDDARFRRAFKVVEKQCELLPEALKERLETDYYHDIDMYQFPEAFAAAFAQLYKPATAEAAAGEVSA